MKVFLNTNQTEVLISQTYVVVLWRGTKKVDDGKSRGLIPANSCVSDFSSSPIDLLPFTKKSNTGPRLHPLHPDLHHHT